MTLKNQSITIIGAGIGGLTAALCLRRMGAEVTLFEQAAAISEVGAGLQISPNGRCVLDALGLGPALSDISVQADAVVLRDHVAGGEVLRLDLRRFAPDQIYGFVHRSDLIDLLASRVRASGVQIRLLQKVDAVRPGPHPSVELSTGSVHRADILVGADGIHSRTRVALNGADTPFFTGQVAWRATVANTFGIGSEAQVWMGPGCHLVCYPLRGGSLVNIVAVQARDGWAGEGWDHLDDPANLKAAFHAFGGVAKQMISAVEAPRLWGLFRHPVAPNWHRDGVALIGDAAHPTLPFLAQGANLAIEDAWVLATCLERAETTDAGLAQYRMQRHDRVARVIEAANGNARKYHLRNPLIRRAAHTALKIGGRLAPARVVRQFDWIYRHDVTKG